MADRSTTAHSAIAVKTQRTEQRSRLGRAYRAGRLICGCVHGTISVDERLGLTHEERQRFWARFHEPLDDELRSELTQLVRRRGAAARRIADDLEAIEIASRTLAVNASASSVTFDHRRCAIAGCATSSSSSA